MASHRHWFDFTTMLQEVCLTPTTIGLLIATVTLYLILKCIFSNGNSKVAALPPGPRGLPLIGYLPFLGERPHETFVKLARKYGNVFGLYLGSRYTLVLCDHASVREAFSKEAFLARPIPSMFTEATQKAPSLLTVNGPVWKEQRRFALHRLRDLGFGKSPLEELINEEITYVLSKMRVSSGEPFDVNKVLVPSMSNNMFSLLFGYRLDHDDPERMEMDALLHHSIRFLNPLNPYNFFPSVIIRVLRFLGIWDFKRFYELNAIFHNFLRKQIDKHMRRWDPANPRDYMDAFITEMNRQKEVDPHSSFTEDMLRGNARVFFGAGSETVRSTMGWLLLLLAKHVEVQRKVQAEVDNVIGRNKRPSWSDHTLMPYTQAVIMETHRWASTVTISLLRCTTQDETVQGYRVPRGTLVFANLWAVHHDPSYWKDPGTFDPSRFLNEDGTKVVKDKALMPFSTGKRACPGEIMAEIELFLYLTSILQQFDICFPNESNKNKFDFDYALSLQPKLRKLVFVSRD